MEYIVFGYLSLYLCDYNWQEESCNPNSRVPFEHFCQPHCIVSIVAWFRVYSGVCRFHQSFLLNWKLKCVLVRVCSPQLTKAALNFHVHKIYWFSHVLSQMLIILWFQSLNLFRHQLRFDLIVCFILSVSKQAKNISLSIQITIIFTIGITQILTVMFLRIANLQNKLRYNFRSIPFLLNALLILISSLKHMLIHYNKWSEKTTKPVHNYLLMSCEFVVYLIFHLLDNNTTCSYLNNVDWCTVYYCSKQNSNLKRIHF